MAIRRQKLDRKVDLTLEGNKVVDLPAGWAFSILCEHHGDIQFDFNLYRAHGRDDLARHMRDAIWSLRHELVGITLNALRKNGLQMFWRFLDDRMRHGVDITRLDQIDRDLIDQYLLWLTLQPVTTGKNKGKPLSLWTRKSVYGQLRTLLINRQNRVPECVNSKLTLPIVAFPNDTQVLQRRRSYSPSEQQRITAALNLDLKVIHESDGKCKLSDAQVLTVHLLVLAMMTGKNLQGLLELTRDSLQPHPLEDREILITRKRRGYGIHVSSYRKEDTSRTKETITTIPQGVAEHFRFLCKFTEPLLEDADPENREHVMLWRVSRHARAGKVVKWSGDHANNGVRDFAKRHGLVDDSGLPLALNIARFRPTMATELYRRTRDIRYVQKVLGHVRASTTARHYVETPLEAERDHSIVVDGMVSHFTRMVINGKVLLAADGQIPAQEVTNLLSGGYNTGIARCRNPFRENEDVCRKFFRCFKCPSMCVFEDDLWRLFSFYYRLLKERVKINPDQWLKTYAPIIRKIDTEIASQFPSEKVDAARLRAREAPHPAWREMAL